MRFSWGLTDHDLLEGVVQLKGAPLQGLVEAAGSHGSKWDGGWGFGLDLITALLEHTELSLGLVGGDPEDVSAATIYKVIEHAPAVSPEGVLADAGAFFTFNWRKARGMSQRSS